jgi:hypothetical protein
MDTNVSEDSEDRGRGVCRNVGTYVPNYMASNSRLQSTFIVAEFEEISNEENCQEKWLHSIQKYSWHMLQIWRVLCNAITGTRDWNQYMVSIFILTFFKPMRRNCITTSEHYGVLCEVHCYCPEVFLDGEISDLKYSWFTSQHNNHFLKPRCCSWSKQVASSLPAGFFLNLFLLPWRWRWYVPPKRRLTLSGLHGVISQKMILFITTAVKTSNPTCS